MRKILGALILFVGSVLHRADDISRFWKPVEATRPDAVSFPAPVIGDPGKRERGTPRRRAVPPDYRRNPLVFFSTAPKDSLVLLPGIGPVLAERIIGARTGKRSFTRWEDLLAIKGIGPKTVDRLKKLAEETEPE